MFVTPPVRVRAGRPAPWILALAAGLCVPGALWAQESPPAEADGGVYDPAAPPVSPPDGRDDPDGFTTGYQAETRAGLFPLRFGEAESPKRMNSAAAAVWVLDRGTIGERLRADGRGAVSARDLPAGEFSVLARDPRGVALFAYRVLRPGAGEDEPAAVIIPTAADRRALPVRLLAPVNDWATARSLIGRRYSADAAPLQLPTGAAPAFPEEEVEATAVDPAGLLEPLRPGGKGVLEHLESDGGDDWRVTGADVYFIRRGELLGKTVTDSRGVFTVPMSFQQGIYSLLTVSETGVALVGLRVGPDPKLPVASAPRRSGDGVLPVRTVAARRVQAAVEMSVAEVGAENLPAALGAVDAAAPAAAAVTPAAAAAGGGLGGVGGAAAGAGAAAGGGGLLGALAGAGGIAAAVDGDDGDDDAAMSADETMSSDGTTGGGTTDGGG